MSGKPQNKFGSKMDRIKPEKMPRQRVQKIWRNVRWAETFPDDSLTVDVADITPNFALRKVALLFEAKKFGECASLIRRLNCVTLDNILREVPLELLHDSLPESLNILESLYVKLYETTESPSEFPRDELHVDQFLQKLVAMFALQSGMNNKDDQNANRVYPSCRNILRVITWIEPNIRRFVRLRKRALETCLRHLGRHGLVECSEGSLMNLHEALKIEFDVVVGQYRSALQKLDELSLSAKHPTGSSVTFGPAPTTSSHHRLMQVCRDDVQDRIIKNRTLYNISEPAISNQYLKKLIHILAKRIEYDKIVLFHDTELRKIGRSSDVDEQVYLSTSLTEYAEGYETVLKLLKEVADEDRITEDEDDGNVTSDNETIEPLMHIDKIRSLSGMNGMLSGKGLGGGSTSRRHRNLKGRSFSAGRPSRPGYRTGTRPSIIHLSQSFNQTEPLPNGLSRAQSALLSHCLPGGNSTLPSRLGKLMTVGEEGAGQEAELRDIRLQLAKSQCLVKHLQDKEKQYYEQLVSQSGSDSRDMESGRVVELIHQYSRLYHADREVALQNLDSVPELNDLQSLKSKILFSVIVLAFRSVQQSIQELRGKLRHVLQLPTAGSSLAPTADPACVDMERNIEEYLCKSHSRLDTTQCAQEVRTQIYATLYDYPCLKKCDGLTMYIERCVSVAWGLSLQRPPYDIIYDSRVFQPDCHSRDESSNTQSILIQNVLWPALVQTNHGPCVYKAVVQT